MRKPPSRDSATPPGNRSRRAIGSSLARRHIEPRPANAVPTAHHTETMPAIDRQPWRMPPAIRPPETRRFPSAWGAVLLNQTWPGVAESAGQQQGLDSAPVLRVLPGQTGQEVTVPNPLRGPLGESPPERAETTTTSPPHRPLANQATS